MTTDNSSKAITRATIQREYEAAMFACARIMSMRSWAIVPTGLELEAHRKAYGRASAKGVILINELFIGSHEIDTLRKVLRHEFAHLAAGLSYQHNSRRFKTINRAFGGATSTTLNSTLIEDSRNGKYRLWAITDQERVVDMGRMTRRSSARINYNPLQRCTLLRGENGADYEIIGCYVYRTDDCAPDPAAYPDAIRDARAAAVIIELKKQRRARETDPEGLRNARAAAGGMARRIKRRTRAA